MLRDLTERRFVDLGVGRQEKHLMARLWEVALK